jgi:hypothetical protein
LNFISFKRIDFGTVASTSESRLSKPTDSAIFVCSSGVAELWRLGNVSLGLRASTVMDRDCVEDPTPLNPPTLRETLLFLPKMLSGFVDPLFLKTEFETEETYLEEDEPESENGIGVVIVVDSLLRFCFASERRRFRVARFASLLARSMNVVAEKNRTEQRKNGVFLFLIWLRKMKILFL